MPYTMHYFWQERPVSQEINHCTFLQISQHQSLSLHIMHEFYEDGIDTGPHRHEDFYAFYIIQGGQGIHVINDHPYVITRGDIYILSPGSVHAYRDYHNLSIDAFYFQPRLFSRDELAALQSLPGFWRLLLPTEQLFGESLVNDSAHMQYLRDYRLHVSPECHHRVEEMVAEICAEFMVQSREAILLTRSQFFRLLVYVARWYSAYPASYTYAPEADPKSNLPCRIGFRDAAQFSRAFHTVFHLTPTAYRATFK